MNIKMIDRCSRCKDMAKINTVYIDKEEINLVKQYICDCGKIIEYKEEINYTIK